VKLAGVLAVAALALAGCGKADVAIVKRPVLPIYVCTNGPLRSPEGCDGKFDAGRLIGLHLHDAQRLARAHGYRVRPVAPLRKGAALTMDYETGRLDVETSSVGNSIVVRIVGKG
jgi:hypothetical protein